VAQSLIQPQTTHMPNNTINISIDYLKLQGARKVTKEGKDYVLIDIAASRAKLFKRQNGQESVYGDFDVKSNKDGENQHGKTHFVCEGVTKEERAAKTRMEIIGNGKEFVFGGGGSSSTSRHQHGSVSAKQHPLIQDSGDDSDIPW